MTLHIPCTPALLRSTNLWCSAVIIPSLLSSILESIPGHAASSLQSQSQIQSPSPSPSPSRPQSQSRQRRRTWQHLYRHVLYPSSEALIISSFPLVYFFGNLYYTDVASLAGVLTVWTLALRGRHWLAALVGHRSFFIQVPPPSSSIMVAGWELVLAFWSVICELRMMKELVELMSH